MMKKLVLVVVMTVMLAACGSGAIDSASVEIVDPNGADVTNSAGGSASDDATSEGTDSTLGETVESETDDSSDAAEGSGTTDPEDTEPIDGEVADSDSSNGESNGELGSDGISRIETAGPGQISLSSEDDLMSTNPDRPTVGRGFLAVDGVTTTNEFSEFVASESTKLAVVEYQLLGVENGNIFDQAFRLKVEGRTYSPLNNINETAVNAGVLNSVVVFEIPQASQALQFEGGVVEGSIDGFTTTFDIQLAPFDPENPILGPVSTVADDVVEATASSVTLVSSGDVMTIEPEQPTNGLATLRVLEATTTTKLDAKGSGPLAKFLIVEYELIASESNNLFSRAFRVNAGGELYTTVTTINTVPKTGEVVNGSMVFLIPRDVFELELEAGVPDRWDEGKQAKYQLTFPQQ